MQTQREFQEKHLIEGPTCVAANIFGEDDLTLDQRQTVIMVADRCGKNPSCIPLLRQQARLGIDDLVRWCNERIWGWTGHGSPDPSPRQRDELRRLAAQPAFAEYRRSALEVARLRCVLQCLDDEEAMQAESKVRHRAVQKRAEERQLREEFDAEERAAADKRFEAWRKARGR